MAIEDELHAAAVKIGRANPQGREGASKYLKHLDYSVFQQCIHCGMCLPTCPTYDETKLERNSPRGRIALMRSIAEGRLEVTQAFGRELYFCLGCLTCETVCPAGVRYGEMFEHGRADIEQAGVLRRPLRDLVRTLTLRWMFIRPRALRAVGRLIWIYQASGLEWLVRRLELTALLPVRLRGLESLTPRVQRHFSDALIRPVETPSGNRKYRVGVKWRAATWDTFDLDRLDAVITNAAGCGAHLKNYAHLLRDDPAYAERAVRWSAKLRDVHEWLAEIGIQAPAGSFPQRVTYHEACHLCHGQKITRQPRQVLKAIPGLELVELRESTWCCGSAGIYNITQPEMSQKLLRRKIENIATTKVQVVAAANPGCSLQLQAGMREANLKLLIAHPISLLAEAYQNSFKA